MRFVARATGDPCRVADVRGYAGTPGGDHRSPRTSWTFLTNHTHVLLCIVRDPHVRLRDVANMVGITERAAQSIVADLVTEGYLTRSRVNGSLTVGGLLDFLQSNSRLIQFARSGLATSSNGHTNGHANGHANGGSSN